MPVPTGFLAAFDITAQGAPTRKRATTGVRVAAAHALIRVADLP